MSPSMLQEIKGLLATPEPPELGPGPRRGVQAEASLNQSLDRLLRPAELSADKEQAVRALVLLWHDHLDTAHGIAQGIENTDGAFVHGIMHRREPDYGNAAYWFRRVGAHAAFPEIARRSAALLGAKPAADLQAQLSPEGKWDAFAFIDACATAGEPAAPEGLRNWLRELQRVETESLLEWLCR